MLCISDRQFCSLSPHPAFAAPWSGIHARRGLWDHNSRSDHHEDAEGSRGDQETQVRRRQGC